MINLIKNICLIFLLTIPLHGHDFHYKIENSQTDAGDLVKSASFVTKPGILYRISKSNDLQTWSEETSIYGLGQTHHIPMMIVSPSTTTSSPTTPQENYKAISGTLIPIIGEPTHYYLTWLVDSAHGLSIRRRKLVDIFTNQWTGIPLTSHRFGGYQLSLHHLSVPALPNLPDSVLSINEQSFITDLLAAADDLNIAIAAGNYHSGNKVTLPPADPNTTGKKFWTVAADDTLDSDGDGTPDYIEFQIAMDSSHPDQSLAQVFNADADGNGVSDGLQKDSDQDGLNDLEDGYTNDPVYDYSTKFSPKYATFEFNSPPATTDYPNGFSPVQINDQGNVLFSQFVWSNGTMHPLTTSGINVEGCGAIGMNNSGLILGTGTLKGGSFPEVLVIWPSYESAPILVKKDNFFGVTSPPIVDFGGNVASDMLIDDAGRFIGYTYNPANTDSIQVVIWNFSNNTFTYQPLPEDQQNSRWVLADTISFGRNSDGYYLSKEGEKIDFTGPIYKIARKPENNNLILFRQLPTDDFDTKKKASSENQSENNNQIWHDSTKTGGIDITSDDVLIVNEHLIRFRSRRKAIDLLTPDLTTEKFQPHGLFDASPAGFLLSSLKDPSNNNQFKIRVYYPIKVVDDAPETGVDNHTAQANSGVFESPENLDEEGKFWIMVPETPSSSGVPTHVTAIIHAPASADRPVEIEADGINITPSILTEPETTVTLFAETGASPGDRNLEFTLGSQDAISHPVGISILERDTVRVTVHLMAYENPNSTNQLDRKIGPSINFTKENIQEELNRVYGPQTNTYFEVSIRGALTPRLVIWDNVYPQNDPHQRSGNGKLDIFGGLPDTQLEDTPGLEGARFVKASNDESADMNIWIVASPNGLNHFVNKDSDGNSTLGGIRGLGLPTTRQIFIEGMSGDNILGEDQETYIEEQLKDRLRVISHEVGHVFLGAGHPGNRGVESITYRGGGISPLPGSDTTLRLMFAPLDSNWKCAGWFEKQARS